MELLVSPTATRDTSQGTELDTQLELTSHERDRGQCGAGAHQPGMHQAALTLVQLLTYPPFQHLRGF